MYNYKEFTYWLKGYLKAIPKNKPVADIITDIMAELEKVNEQDLPKADKKAEKILEDWLEKFPPNPNIPTPFDNIVVMYGCNSNPYKFDSGTTITTTNIYEHKPDKQTE